MKLRDLLPSEQVKPDGYVKERLERGRARLMEGATKRKECIRFWRGDQYVHVSGDNYLVKQQTVTNPDGTGKPAHRVRTTRNLLLDVVAREVSATTQRVPSYEVTASSTDPDRLSAANLSQRVSLWGYDEWSVRKATVKTVTNAVVADEGFAWPFFDNTIGPFIKDGEKLVGQGNVRIRTFGPNEVYWEPGVDFDDSRWHAVEQAKPIDEVYQLPGFVGGKLKLDATDSDLLSEKSAQAKLVMVTDYLERPCPTKPDGSWVTLANGRVIVEERPYPCLDGKGNPVDEPVLHKLAYFTDPQSDRDMGLLRHLLDAQRTYNDCTNKQLEWKNLALNKQLFALPNALKTTLNDEPGAVFTVTDLNAVKDRDPGQVPPDLASIKEEAREDIGRIAAQNDLPNQVEAGKAIAVFNERDQNRRADFIQALAEFHSRLMRHCLYLVQRHFSEKRLLKIRGQFGPETQSFRGADLKSEVDVRVNPGSIEPLTRDGILNQVTSLGTLFPGSFSMEKALAAINGGSISALDDGYQAQVQKQQREIQQMLALEHTLSPAAGPEHWQAAGIPIVKPWDEDAIHLDELHKFMESEQFDNLPVPVQFVLEVHEQSHRAQQAQKAAQAAQAQAAAAEMNGAANAAKDQAPPPAPSAPITA